MLSESSVAWRSCLPFCGSQLKAPLELKNRKQKLYEAWHDKTTSRLDRKVLARESRMNKVENITKFNASDC